MYSLHTSLIIAGMILTGAGRSVAVKIFYQLGFCNPLFVTLLYLAGQGLSLLVYFVEKIYQEKVSAVFPAVVDDDSHEVHDKGGKGKEYSMVELSEVAVDDGVFVIDDDDDSNEIIDHGGMDEKKDDDDEIDEENQQKRVVGKKKGWLRGNQQIYKSLQQKDSSIVHEDDDEQIDLPNDAVTGIEASNNERDRDDGFSNESSPQANDTCDNQQPGHKPGRKRKRRGSGTGLTSESKEAVAWVHKIPTHLKPAIPGFFNLCNSAMRWASLVFVAASTAEMLISGLELILSTVAARIIRKRLVSKMRWAGVCVVALGLIVVRIADSGGGANESSGEDENVDISENNNATNAEEGLSDNDDNTSSLDDRLIGDILIVGQCIMSIIQDMAEELFMQESDFPPTLLLGMEGLFGLVFGIPLYLCLASHFGESPSETLNEVTSSSFNIMYVVALTCLFTVTGIFNIAATSVTSSMTRNVWKNFRTVLVWGLGLVIFYSTGNADLGEEWRIPNSFFVLAGFVVMLSGAFLYYKNDDDLPCWAKISLLRSVVDRIVVRIFLR